MPHDLFGDVLLCPPIARKRRSSVFAVSIIAHGAVLLALLVVPLLVPGLLPTPQRALAFFTTTAVLPVAPPPPRLPVQASSSPAAAPTAIVSPSAAPLEAPKGFTPETGIESATARLGGPAGLGEVGTVVGVGAIGAGEAAIPPPPAAPIRQHSGIRPPQKIVDVAPTYPAAARAARVQGTVIIEATIDARGHVEAARVVTSVQLLDQAALDAVRRWRFAPTLLSGVPVPVIMTVMVHFTLQ